MANRSLIARLPAQPLAQEQVGDITLKRYLAADGIPEAFSGVIFSGSLRYHVDAFRFVAEHALPRSVRLADMRLIAVDVRGTFMERQVWRRTLEDCDVDLIFTVTAAGFVAQTWFVPRSAPDDIPSNERNLFDRRRGFPMSPYDPLLWPGAPIKSRRTARAAFAAAGDVNEFFAGLKGPGLRSQVQR